MLRSANGVQEGVGTGERALAEMIPAVTVLLSPNGLPTAMTHSPTFTLSLLAATDNIVVPIGWFVGWIETSDNIYSFAINLDISDSKFLPKREEIVREYFKNINVIK